MRGGIRQRRERVVWLFESTRPPISETDSSMHFGIISQEEAETLRFIVTLSSTCRCHG